MTTQLAHDTCAPPDRDATERAPSDLAPRHEIPTDRAPSDRGGFDPAMGDRADRDRALFDRVAAEYCAKDLTPASRRARRRRLLRTLAALPPMARPDVLEAGCGAGFAATYLRGRVGRYVGVDYSENLIGLARRTNAGPGVRFDVADLTTYAPAEPVDVVFMVGVLHHLPDPPAAVRHMTSWLRPGGWFVANEPQPGNPLVQFARRVRKRVDARYSDEQEELSAGALEAALRAAGLTHVRIVPQGLLSTPFAEVILRPQWLARVASAAACLLDSLFEHAPRALLRRCTWNLIAAGQRAGA